MRVTLHDFTCATCGKPFQHHKPDKKYCSHTCYANRHPHVTITCEQCGDAKLVPWRGRNAKYCSTECAGRAASIRQHVDRVQATCAWTECGKTFNVLPRMVGTAKYCSRSCSELAVRGGLPAIVTLTCEGCGEAFEKPFVYRNTRFCSKSCAHRGERNGMYGKPGSFAGKPAWNAGLTTSVDERVAALGKKVSGTLRSLFASGKLSHAGAKNSMYGHVSSMLTSAQRRRYSLAAIKRVLSGVSGYKTGHVTGLYDAKKSLNSVRFKSSWELAAMMCWDAADDVASYEYEPTVIELDDGTHAVPDFLVVYVTGHRAYVEIKPTALQKIPHVAKRLERVKRCVEKSSGVNYVLFGNIEIDACKSMLGKEFDDAVERYKGGCTNVRDCVSDR